MTQSRRASGLFVFSLGTICFLQGCASSRPQSFATSFLPAPPAAEVPSETPLDLPPSSRTVPYLSEMPNLVPKVPIEIERRLDTAEERFEAGKKAYQAGDIQIARQEFDRTLDVLLSAPEDLPERRRL